MRPFLVLCVLLLTCTVAIAAEIPAPMLNAMGLSGIQTLSDAQGQAIRGSGFVSNEAYINAGQQAIVNATQLLRVSGKASAGNVLYVDAGKQAKVNAYQVVVVKPGGRVSAINYAAISAGAKAVVNLNQSISVRR